MNIYKLEGTGYCIEVIVSRYTKEPDKLAKFAKMASHYRGSFNEKDARKVFDLMSSVLRMAE